MAYKWLGMKRLTWGEVKKLHKEGKLVGCYKLYEDGTESEIASNYDFIDDILEHQENGGEFGEEIDTVVLELADGKKIEAPVVVDISELGCLDELEYTLWHTIEDYMVLFGIRTGDDEPDWATVKAVQEKIIEVLMDAGVDFKILTDEQMAEMQKQIARGGDDRCFCYGLYENYSTCEIKNKCIKCGAYHMNAKPPGKRRER